MTRLGRSSHGLVNGLKLHLEARGGEKGAQVEPVIVGRVVLGVVRGCEGGHFVTVDAVEEVKVLDLLRHLLVKRLGRLETARRDAIGRRFEPHASCSDGRGELSPVIPTVTKLEEG